MGIFEIPQLAANDKKSEGEQSKSFHTVSSFLLRIAGQINLWEDSVLEEFFLLACYSRQPFPELGDSFFCRT
jgi:hypothetical protein